MEVVHSRMHLHKLPSQVLVELLTLVAQVQRSAVQVVVVLEASAPIVRAELLPAESAQVIRLVVSQLITVVEAELRSMAGMYRGLELEEVAVVARARLAHHCQPAATHLLTREEAAEADMTVLPEESEDRGF